MIRVEGGGRRVVDVANLASSFVFLRCAPFAPRANFTRALVAALGCFGGGRSAGLVARSTARRA